MLTVSNNFKNAMKQPVKELDAYITGGDVSIRSEDDLISFKISCDSGLCKTAMRKLEAKYTGEHNLLGQWVHVSLGVKLEDGIFEYVDYGSFLISEITTVKDTGVTTIVGYDKMINSMKVYQVLDVEYPINLIDYTRALCEACNIELGNDNFTTHNNWSITQELWENIEGITYRDIFTQIAQATGTVCIISNDDKVYFKPLTDTGEVLTYDNMFKLKLEPKYGEINSVVLARSPQEDNIYRRDETSIQNNGLTEFRIENNEIIDKDRDNAITPIYNALHGVNYFPFESTTEGLGWYEIGDGLTIINDTGDTFNTNLFNISVSMDGSLKETLKTVAETKTQTQYQYATTLGKRVKNTEIITNKQEQWIQQLVSDMYEQDGVINENFTKVYQDIINIVNNVQNSGGNNLIKNSVMFAYDNNNVPTDWNITSTGNLLNISKVVKGVCNNGEIAYESGTTSLERTDTNITFTVNTAWRGITTDFMEVVPQEIYTYKESGALAVEYYFYAYDKDKNYMYGVSKRKHDNLCEITIPQNAKYIRISITATSIGTFTIDHPCFQLGYQDYKTYNNGELIIGTNTESLNAGCLSGHSFTLLEKKASQKILVNTDSVYTFSTRIKKSLAGSCYVKLYNSEEEHIIEINNNEESFYGEYALQTLLPKDTYYIVEFYGSSDSEATFTDSMLALGEYKSQWTQANGEIMNTQVIINSGGVLVKSSIYLGDYTIMSPLEFAGYSNINGTITKVFSLNKETTNVTKLKAEKEIKMTPIKVVPITSGELQGWAFVPSTEEV